MSATEAAPLVGGIEAGGTKFVCAIGSGPDDHEEVRFPTTSPEETFARVAEFFEAQIALRGSLQAMGIGTFGPANLDPTSNTYGSVTTTPKPGWQNTDFVGAVRSIVGSDVPIAFDTDVNAAAWGEQRWGAGRDFDDFVYITVGTGIGGGVVSGGRLVHGFGHPEIGHLRVPHDLEADPFPGSCPYHGDCLEGLASGPALAARWNVDARELPESHPAWALQARYLADALVNLAMTTSPGRFILGGGVMDQDHLLHLVREEFTKRISGYLSLPPADELIVRPQLASRAGTLGTFALAQDLLE